MKKILWYVLGILVFLVGFSAASAFSGSGSGTALDPYEITTCEQLQEMNDDLDADYELVNDIDCTGTNPFSTVGNGVTPFTGTLDGNGFEVSNITIVGVNYVGLFGYTNGATITDIGIASGSVSATGSEVGSIAGHLGNSTIDNVYSNIAVSGINSTGGLFGAIIDSTVTDSHATGNVTATDPGGTAVGGFVGYVGGSGSTITRCYATGDVTFDGVAVGGFVGLVDDAATVFSQSYATGNVSAPDIVGGFGGLFAAIAENVYATGNVSTISNSFGFGYVTGASITNAYSTGYISGDPGGNNGGFVPDDGGFTPITSSYWDSDTSGIATTNGGIDGEPKTTTEMKQQATFTDWDFSTIWGMSETINDGYPFLLALTAPVVEHATPIDTATDVPVNTHLVINFSEPMDPDSFVITTSPCSESCMTYDISWAAGEEEVTFNPTTNFENDTEYTITISIDDASGTPLADDYEWSFTTVADDSEPAPTRSSRREVAFGCKDSNAINYKSKFVRHKQSLCEYATPTPVTQPTVTFTRDLKLGMTGDDVSRLQNYLITQNKGPAALALKNHGTTNYFGPLTQAALIEYQKSQNITPAVGFFGPVTRGVVEGEIF